MTASPIFHGAFVIERRYPAPPARVFAAWTDPALKARWFIGPEGWSQIERTLDVRTGGSEILHGRFAGAGGRETLFTARYHQVVGDRRLAYVYDMHIDGRHHSVSLATVEFIADGGGTLQRFHEQVAFLDGTTADQGVPSREHGTAAHLDRIHALFA
jgi:uncharacterized protein YndB with AHSA1/START domain